MPPLRALMTKCTIFFVSHQFNALIAHSSMNQKGSQVSLNDLNLRLIPATIAEARTNNNHPESQIKELQKLVWDINMFIHVAYLFTN